MEDAPYSNRELTEMFNTADERADSFHNKLMERMDVFESNTSTSLMSIETQTTQTNGRVKDLELSRARQEGFNKALAIFGAVAWALCFAFTGWVALQIIATGNKLENLNTRLSAYDITIQK